MSTFANSEDPDEMQHNAAFLCKGKKDFQAKNTIIFKHYNLTPLDMCNELSKVLSQTSRMNPLVYKGLKSSLLLCGKAIYTIKSLSEAHALIEAHSPVWTQHYGELQWLSG